MQYCFGIDVGGTSVKMGLFETEGTIVDKWEIKTRTENNGDAVLPDVAASLKDKMKEKGIDAGQITGIGVGIPAPVDENGIVKDSANIGWGYKEVTRELKELTGLAVEAGNDANVAALGEMWLGAGKGFKNLIMVTLGTGVGGGVIVDGRPVVGEHGAGGEIGHICVNYEETAVCGCGNRGCLEQYASATGITRIAKLKIETYKGDTILKQRDINAKTVFDALKEGDEAAKEIVEEFGTYLGHGLANLAAVVDPAVVVIGGGVSKAGRVLIEYVEKHFKERAFFANKETEFVLARLGNDAGICGAAKLIIDKR